MPIYETRKRDGVRRTIYANTYAPASGGKSQNQSQNRLEKHVGGLDKKDMISGRG